MKECYVKPLENLCVCTHASACDDLKLSEVLDKGVCFWL
jgi:hypothetical protein